MRQERDQMRQECDAALQQVAELERLNDEILRGVPDRVPRPELEHRVDLPRQIAEPEPEPVELPELRGIDCPYVLHTNPRSSPFSASFAYS